MPENPAIQLTIEHLEGRNVIRAVLRAATVGPVRASALVLSSLVTATVMAPSKGTPALKPDVYLVDQSAEADTDLES